MKRLLIVLALVVCGTGAAAAQDREARTALDVLRPEARARVVVSDSTLQFRTRAVPGGRLDVDAGVLRARYRVGRRVAAAPPADAARAYLAAEAPTFGLAPETADLAVASVTRTRYSSHVTFQQTLAGVPVYGRTVKVNLDREGQPTLVLSSYAPHLRAVAGFNPRPTLSATDAAERARNLVSQTGAVVTTPELFVYPTKTPRLAWLLTAWPQDAPAEWEVLLDAHTGEILRLFDQTTHPADKRALDPAGTSTGRPASRSAAPARAFVQGSGLVFDPDPLTTAGVAYGGAYVDADDADVAALNAERIEVPLNDISQGTDGLYRLEGPFAAVDGSSLIGGTAFDPPAEADPNGFRYGRADDDFEAVMSYYHLDKSQRYVQSLDVGRDIQNRPVRVNPHGLGGQDNSQYYVGLNAIALGDGGIDDAEDADVIWHEYGHALLQESAPGLLLHPEGQALHEGWGDYWAASYSRWLSENNPSFNQDWRKVYTWDGNETWNGRTVDRQGSYLDGLTGNKYTDGLLWATTLMEIYDVLGRIVIDRLNLSSHIYLGASATLADAAEVLIQADLDLYDGEHVGVLVERLAARGFVDPAAFGPVVAHEPLPYIEQAGAVIAVTVHVTSFEASVTRVAFVYSVNGAAYEELDLAPEGGTRYGAVLTLPPEATEIAYYIEATDSGGLRSRLPAGAPSETFAFGVGTDVEPPSIDHEPILQAALQAWPARVFAEVTDNQGVDSVWVTFSVAAPDGATVVEGSFALNPDEDRFTGVFPVSTDLLEDGSTVRYRLHARDVALAGNEAVLPAQGTFSFVVAIEGVLAAYNFETAQGVTAAGIWGRGAPTYGLEVAHSGDKVWATNLAAAYPDFSQHSTLDLPPLSLSLVDAAYLTFWHWYDLEHSGQVFPDAFSAESLWDGGNVKVSVDGGATWTVAQPLEGYNGRLESGTGNPLGGEQAFGGYSFGWRRVIVPLPLASDVRVRFHFGTDGSNELSSLFYAGWYLDDVRVTTDLPGDGTPPTLLEGPPATRSVDAGRTPPPLFVRAQDDTGLEAVLAVYEIIDASGDRTPGTLRLAMQPDDLTAYAGTIAPARLLDVGDRIEYRLRLRDFDGNETLFPASGQEPLHIDVRLAERLSALSAVRATGQWRPQGDGWSVVVVGTGVVPLSSLVLTPFDLPANAEAITFSLAHTHRFTSGVGGNLKVSVDDGTTWNVLDPDGGYDGTFAQAAGHPMNGEPVLTGLRTEQTETAFDLTPFAGRQVRLRVDFGTTRALQATEFWTIEEATLTYATLDEDFEIPLELALHANFPDPFADATTFSYTLPEAMQVRLELYNVVGQRLAVLVDGDQEAGTHTLTMGRGALAGGVYFLRMLAGGTQKVERMVVLR